MRSTPTSLRVCRCSSRAGFYVRLRFNALVGRPVDVELDGLPPAAITLFVATVSASGGFLVWVAMRASDRVLPPDPWALWPGLAIFAAYLSVAGMLATTQVKRLRTEGVLSTSAVAFTAIFYTCAISHYAYALGHVKTDWHMAIADTLGVVGAIAFAAIVYRLRRTHHRRYASTVGGSRIRTPQRQPPWSQTTTDDLAPDLPRTEGRPAESSRESAQTSQVTPTSPASARTPSAKPGPTPRP